MKTIKKHWKDYLKVSIALIVGMIVSLIVVDANSSYLYNSNDVEFDNENVGLTLNGNSVDNVQDALSALYAKLNSSVACATGYTRISSSMGTNYVCASTQQTAANALIANASEIGLENVADAYRYVGANTETNNYVSFNGELWRIIGVYPITTTINNESVTKNYLKIVKAVPLSSTRQYFLSTSGAANTWSTSSLKKYLNESTDGFYYNLSDDIKSMIFDGGTWYIGGNTYSANASTSYTNAKKTGAAQKVGLVASYEYLYAAGTECQSTAGSSYSSGCAAKDWLYPTLTTTESGSSSSVWLMTPNSGNTTNALYVESSSGRVNSNAVTGYFYVSPAVYLQSTITFTGGSGKSGDPYTLGTIE